ncbi:hypothetical protein ACWGJW_11430 [Streptomyces nigrescens]
MDLQYQAATRRSCLWKGRRGLTALFWSDISPYGAFRLERDERLGLGHPAALPGPKSRG